MAGGRVKAGDRVKAERSKGLNVRCQPGAVTTATAYLSADAKERVKELHFKNLLDMKLEKLTSRELAAWLMDTAEIQTNPDRIELNIKPGVSLCITQEIVHLILGMPRGSVEVLPSLPRNEAVEAFKLMYSVLKLSVDKRKEAEAQEKKQPSEQPSGDQDKEARDDYQEKQWPRDDDEEQEPSDDDDEDEEQQSSDDNLEQKRKVFTVKNIHYLLKELEDVEMAVKFFFLLMLERLLLPSTLHYSSVRMVEAVQDLEKLQCIDWCKLVYENLKEAVLNWKKTSSSKRQINGCAILLMIFIPIIHSIGTRLAACKMQETALQEAALSQNPFRSRKTLYVLLMFTLSGVKNIVHQFQCNTYDMVAVVL